MMTPRFRLGQDELFVYVTVELPYVKLSDVEVSVQGTQFDLYLKPYYLKLGFPHPLRDDASEGKYDLEKREACFKLSKKDPGTVFEDLDMIAKLLSPKKPKTRGFVEVLAGHEDMEDDTPLSTSEHRYGFSRNFQNFFEQLPEAQYELLDFDPDVYCVSARAQVALQRAQEDFQLDRYLTDMDEEAIADLAAKSTEALLHSYLPSLEEAMSALQLDAVLRLGNREQIIHPALVPCLFRQTFDVVFAFCYELRSMDGELSCESAWAINKVSATLSCMLEFDDLPDVVRSCFRRCLVYPLFRSELLAIAALHDSQALVAAGKAGVLRVLLAVKHAFERSEPRYLLNKLFIDDLAVWVQKIDSGVFLEFQAAVRALGPPPLAALDLDFSVT